ncbi:MAG: sulfur oxidation c-type cytochrome SoxA [Thiotrichales bacterium]
MLKKAWYVLPIALALAGTVSADSSPAPEDVLEGLIKKIDSKYLTQSEQNLMMMPDNPALFLAEDGEKLFKQARGPKNATLEGCDFGKGPGVLKGAVVELPRYFADTGKVMDLESRLVHCMKTVQGFTDEDDAIKKRHGSGTDMMKLQTYISMQSNGMAWNPPLNHPLEKAMRDAGEVLFYRRSGPMDFNCQTCHASTGLRIRASVLPNLNIPEEWTKAISWPAERPTNQAVRSSQHRLLECLWQMRYPWPNAGSDLTIAMISFWTDKARGQPAILPDLKR